jgi:hypothetical protein
MSDSDKINATHDAVLTLVSEFKGFKDLCALKHKTLDTDVQKLDKTLHGNGEPGLVDEHLELERRFDKAETKLITYAVAAVAIITFLTPKIYSVLGWSMK